MSITIRRLTPADAEEYRICRLDALLDTPHAFASSYEEESHHTLAVLKARLHSENLDSATFGAFDGERLVGLTGIFREARLKRRHKGNIVSVFVRPEYRGQGIGSRLMQAAIAHAQTLKGVERLDLGVESTNAPAKALYTSLGFVTWGVEPGFLKIGDRQYDEDHMTLKL
ncbi:MAG: GNAT family N-acetyltransferase [Bacteroidota bacterium]|nr:GNAT family N-acetyltransferase [Bacteroidota bacterium]MDP4233495.1 GNAT family N-acetyltransferase [Bacteroidota bacterium]MDP4287941.1 GNAT family N-acetyltransferase [Bacteroidota bacterium]